MRVAVELFHIAAGLILALLLTAATAWSYPLGYAVIWWCGTGVMVATVLMGIGPLRRARREDRGGR